MKKHDEDPLAYQIGFGSPRGVVHQPSTVGITSVMWPRFFTPVDPSKTWAPRPPYPFDNLETWFIWWCAVNQYWGPGLFREFVVPVHLQLPNLSWDTSSEPILTKLKIFKMLQLSQLLRLGTRVRKAPRCGEGVARVCVCVCACV